MIGALLERVFAAVVLPNFLVTGQKICFPSRFMTRMVILFEGTLLKEQDSRLKSYCSHRAHCCIMVALYLVRVPVMIIISGICRKGNGQTHQKDSQ